MKTTITLAMPERWRNTRHIRLVTGLTLLTYVASHLLNHSLGNVSITWMETGLRVQKWLWQGIAGTVVLYAALLTHFALGLSAFHKRRHFGWTRAEIAQLCLGLCIPFLLMNHLFVTRMALVQFGLQKGYAQELYSFWVASPSLGIQQVAVLVIAWIHGCIGVYLWLRLKPSFDRIKSFLAVAAVVLPLLALLGFFQGGRRVLQELQYDPAWRAASLAPWQVGQPAQNAVLRWERDLSLATVAGLMVLILLLRGLRGWREHRGGLIRVVYPGGQVARVPLGFSILEASRVARIPHASLCGGRARCSTCRVRITQGLSRLPPPRASEQAVLARFNACPRTRLACQTRPVADVAAEPLLPPLLGQQSARRAVNPQPGQERFIVALVVDMRNSTRLAERHLPFDAVFILDRFVNAIGSAVAEAGGRRSQFTGDGLIAFFGDACEIDEACRQAVHAVGLIDRNVAALNRALDDELAEFICYGVGIHGSTAVVGEIGYGEGRMLTTLGDAANVATRLEAVCKDLGCAAVISDEVMQRTGTAAWFPAQEIRVRGRQAPLLVRVIHEATRLLPERSPVERDAISHGSQHKRGAWTQ